MGSWSVCDIIINAHRERIGLLEYHTYTFAEKVHIHVSVDVFAVKLYFSCDGTSLYKIVHTVEGFQKCGFTTTAGPDKSCDLFFRDLHIDAFQCMKVSVMKIHIIYQNFCFFTHDQFIILSLFFWLPDRTGH